MTLGQEIILYFEIIPIFLLIIAGIIQSWLDEKKAFKSEIKALRKAYRQQNEEFEKYDFYRSLGWR